MKKLILLILLCVQINVSAKIEIKNKQQFALGSTCTIIGLISSYFMYKYTKDYFMHQIDYRKKRKKLNKLSSELEDLCNQKWDDEVAGSFRVTYNEAGNLCLQVNELENKKDYIKNMFEWNFMIALFMFGLGSDKMFHNISII